MSILLALSLIDLAKELIKAGEHDKAEETAQKAVKVAKGEITPEEAQEHLDKANQG